MWTRVDAHVHLHPGFPVGRFLDHVAGNLGSGDPPSSWTGALLLTESRGVRRFDELAAGPRERDGWTLEGTGEERALVARRRDGARILVVAGRQVVTRERLEVLALGVRDEIPDGAPIEVAIAEAIDRGGLAVVPWGFGKWWGARGRIVAGVVAAGPRPRLFLGDNGGRPRLAPRPGLFDVAERRGMRVLPGSDPLPFPREVRRAGRYGFTLEGAPDPGRPASWLLDRIAAPGPGFAPIGGRAALGEFLRNQLAMQWRLRLGRT